MKISVIIPTFNEEGQIVQLIKYLREYAGTYLPEIIVVDGNSTDKTVTNAKIAGAQVIKSNMKSRAIQMNMGAKMAKGEILYFLHADAFPPTSFATDILLAISAGNNAGCFSYRFDSDKTLLRINSYCTRFNGIFCGGGDQSLYILNSRFRNLGGFREDYHLMEDFEITGRIRKQIGRFHLIKKDMKVSARKYETNDYMRVNFVNLLIFCLFKIGVSQPKLANLYVKYLKPYNEPHRQKI